MLTFRDMTLDDRDTVLPMVDAFYRSNAVDHPVPREIVERSFLAAAGNEPLLRGTLIFEEGRLAGYLYVTLCYSAEVGGTCVFIEEVYLLPEFRGRGLGRQVLEWIFTQYPDSRRFRLEVTCCQAVLVTFADRLGLTPEQANALGAHFGSGMRHGSTCGAVSGALMVLGLLGCDEKQSTALLRDFRTRHGALDCADLLRASKERGELRKDHCDSLVLEMSRFLEELLREQST